MDVNRAIAYGDLATAAIATVAMQVVAGGGVSTRNLGRDLLRVGGAAVMAAQVTDIMSTRSYGWVKDAIGDSMGDKSERYARWLAKGAVAGAAGLALLYAAGDIPALATTRALVPGAVIGASTVIGDHVGLYIVDAMRASSTEEE